MPLCKFTDDYILFDVTPVDNLFIAEYMLTAPGDFVKVYLYGLRLCYSRSEESLEHMASVLGLEQDTVQNAYLYWEKHGLVRRLSDVPPSYEYINLRTLVLNSASPAAQEENSLYQMSGFNSRLLKILTDRTLHGEDYASIYKCLDDFGMTEEAFLTIARNMAQANKKRGAKSPTVASIIKKARELAKHNIISFEAVERYYSENCFDVAKRLLAHLGIFREPTNDEAWLCSKWLSNGFDEETLRLLCAQMTSARKPSLAYLDKIAENYHLLGLHTRAQIEAYKTDRLSPLKEVLSALGGGVSINDDLLRQHEAWIARGFEQDLIKTVAGLCNASKKGTWNYLAQVLEGYARNGIFTTAAYEAQRQERERVKALACELLAIAGENRAPSLQERRQAESWLSSGIGEDLLREAAKLAVPSRDKFAYMGKVLEAWRSSGILSAPKHVEKTVSGNARPSKEVAAHRYEQRQYEESDFDDLFVDLNSMEKEHHEPK